MPSRNFALFPQIVRPLRLLAHLLANPSILQKDMSFFSLETIQVFAESIGLSNLNEEIAIPLVQEVEYRVRELIQDAHKFMVHCRRAKLTCDDLNSALRMKHSEPLYGYDPTEPLNFRLVPHTNLFFTPDPEIDLDVLLNAPLPKAPLKPHFSAHWLAIEGVQPMIAENPSVPQTLSTTTTTTTTAQPTVPTVDTKEPADKAVLVTAKKDISLLQEDADVTPCVKHVLSKEMQLFYDTVINCINSPKDEERSCALESLKNDAGLQQLLPYFIQYASENIARNLKNSPVLLLMLEMCNTLMLNGHLFVEPYLHQLMPVLLSCIVGKTIGLNGSLEQQLKVRRSASHVVSFIERKYASAYQTLQLRTCKTLSKCLQDSGMPLCCHYGAIYCFNELGIDSFESFVLPGLASYVGALAYEQRFEPGKYSDDQRNELEAVWKLLLSICNRYTNSPDSKPNNRELIEEVFGDELFLTDVAMEL